MRGVSKRRACCGSGVASLILCLATVRGPQVAVCLRDGFAWSAMWATCSRGRDCGRLRLSDFVLADGRTLFTAWAALRQKPLPTLYLAQQGTKTHRGARAPLRELVPRGDILCPVNNLGLLLEAYARCGQAATDHLVRPLAKDRRSFREEGLTSQALGGRLTTWLSRLGLGGEETCHSFRRGRLQHERRAGAASAALLSLGEMSAPGTLKRYLDPGRHVDPRGQPRRKA